MSGEHPTKLDVSQLEDEIKRLRKENEALKQWVKEVSAYLNMIHSPTRIARLIKEARELERGEEN